MSRVRRTLSWYERDGDALVGEVDLRSISLAQLRRWFGLGASNPMADSFPVKARQAEHLRAALGRPIHLDRYSYFVVSAAAHFQLPPSRPSRVLILRNAPTAVLVDSTDRILEISALHALPRAFVHEERGWYRGLAVMGGDVVPVVNHNAFLDKAELEVLRAGLERVRGEVMA